MLIAPAEELVEQEKKEFNVQADRSNLATLHSIAMVINYAKAADVANLISDKSSGILSPRGSISVDPRTNTIWLQDINRQLEKIKRLVMQIDGANQTSAY